MKFLSLVTLVSSCLILQGCLNKEKLSDMPEAENQVITEDGRHFVTSGKGLAEITQSNGTLSLDYIDAGCDAYNGIVSFDDRLIVVCADSALINARHTLISAQLETGVKPEMSELMVLDNMSLPNGMTLTPENDALLIADYVLLGRGKVSKFDLSINDNVLSAQLNDLNFLNIEQNIYSPNGLKFSGNDLYLTDFDYTSISSRVVKVSFLDGAYLDTDVLYSKTTILDDLLPTCGGVLTGDFLNGRLVFINSEGEVFRSDYQEFPGLSSMVWGQAPLFDANTLVITERGIIQDSISSIGNQISTVEISNSILNDVGANCQ